MYYSSLHLHRRRLQDRGFETKQRAFQGTALCDNDIIRRFLERLGSWSTSSHLHHRRLQPGPALSTCGYVLERRNVQLITLVGQLIAWRSRVQHQAVTSSRSRHMWQWHHMTGPRRGLCLVQSLHSQYGGCRVHFYIGRRRNGVHIVIRNFLQRQFSVFCSF